jgi:orotidine-5'-phosphate decarboxylase
MSGERTLPTKTPTKSTMNPSNGFSGAERIIVEADYVSHGTQLSTVAAAVNHLASQLKGTGVTLKLGPSLRACGYFLGRSVQDNYGLPVFADLALYGNKATLLADAAYLAELEPAMVSVSCACGLETMGPFAQALPGVDIIGTTLPFGQDDKVSMSMYSLTSTEIIWKHAAQAYLSGFKGITCPPLLIGEFKRKFSRPLRYIVPDTNHSTVLDSIKAGASRVVLSYGFVANSADPRATVLGVIEQIKATTT